MNDQALIDAMSRTIRFLSHPLVAPLALVIVTASVALSIATSGVPLLICDHTGPSWFGGCKWDPGASYMNTIQNEVQLVIMFATLSVASKLGTEARRARHVAEHTRKDLGLGAAPPLPDEPKPSRRRRKP